MPHNKSETIHSQQNHDSIKEEATTLKANKAAVRAPNVNEINKNNQS